jgi:hypothetical protein
MQFNSATPSELCLPLLRIPILAGGDAIGGIAAAIGRVVVLVDGRPEERDRRDRPAMLCFAPSKISPARSVSSCSIRCMPI